METTTVMCMLVSVEFSQHLSLDTNYTGHVVFILLKKKSH